MLISFKKLVINKINLLFMIILIIPNMINFGGGPWASLSINHVPMSLWLVNFYIIIRLHQTLLSKISINIYKANLKFKPTCHVVNKTYVMNSSGKFNQSQSVLWLN